MSAATACPFCGTSKTRSTLLEDTVFNGKTFEYKKCVNCGLIYVCPSPNQDDYEKMYPVEYQGKLSRELLHISTEKLKIIKKHTDKNLVLDYGCGGGHFVNEATLQGFHCTGVEFNPELVENLTSTFPEMKFFTLDEFYQRNEKYEIIHLSNVLEHLTNPIEIVQKLKGKLLPGGIFVFQGPIENNFSLNRMLLLTVFGLRKFLGKKAHHPPRHVFHSNYQSQLAFFTGMELERIYYKAGDSAWPLPSNWKDCNSLKKKLMYVVGRISVNFSRLNSTWGNEFLFIGKVKE